MYKGKKKRTVRFKKKNKIIKKKQRKMLGPVYKYNIQYKMASEYMYKTKLRG